MAKPKPERTAEDVLTKLSERFEEAAILCLDLILKQLKNPYDDIVCTCGKVHKIPSMSLTSIASTSKVVSDRYMEISDKIIELKRLRNDLAAVEPGSPEEEEILANYKERQNQVHTRQ